MSEILFDDKGLTVALDIVDDALCVELTTSEDGPDLSTDDEVVVVADGRGCAVDVDSPRRATATVVSELPEEPEPLTLMVRVHEFFEGWELFSDVKSDEQ